MSILKTQNREITKILLTKDLYNKAQLPMLTSWASFVCCIILLRLSTD